MRVACLHTADSNVAVFDAAAAGLGVALVHHVRADLLADAEAAGGLTDPIAARTRVALSALKAQADAVLLTCSTLGPACGDAVRVDAALASQAAQAAAGRAVVVLCAVATTLLPTRALFAAAGLNDGLQVRLVPGAWDLFRAGDLAGYHRLIAAEADAAMADGALVALAQASMSGAAALCTRGTPLTSPRAGLAAAISTGAVRHA